MSMKSVINCLLQSSPALPTTSGIHDLQVLRSQVERIRQEYFLSAPSVQQRRLILRDEVQRVAGDPVPQDARLDR
jgi:hypothetical protein